MIFLVKYKNWRTTIFPSNHRELIIFLNSYRMSYKWNRYNARMLGQSVCIAVPLNSLVVAVFLNACKYHHTRSHTGRFSLVTRFLVYLADYGWIMKRISYFYVGFCKTNTFMGELVVLKTKVVKYLKWLMLKIHKWMDTNWCKFWSLFICGI